MDILGSIGKLYTFILLVVLFLGSGLALWAAINTIMNKKEKIKESTDRIKTTLNSNIQSVKNKNILGGINMRNSGFIKLAVFSFVGIIISAAILAALPKYSSSSMNMGTQYGNNSMNMQGMSGYSMQAGMYNNTDLSSVQQQLNQIQQQINQIQNQMSNSSMNGMQSNSGNMNNNGSMNNNSMNSNSMNNNNSNSNSNSSSMSSMPMM